MARYLEDEYFNNTNDYYWDDEDQDDFSSYTSESDIYDPDETEEPESQYDETIRDETILYTEWRLLTINNITLRVSNTGRIQYPNVSMFHIVSGLKYQGTPYRYVNVGRRKYFVHDLMWRAFYPTDPIPSNYEVRHNNDTPLDAENCYVNELPYLDLYVKEICNV